MKSVTTVIEKMALKRRTLQIVCVCLILNLRATEGLKILDGIVNLKEDILHFKEGLFKGVKGKHMNDMIVFLMGETVSVLVREGIFRL